MLAIRLCSRHQALDRDCSRLQCYAQDYMLGITSNINDFALSSHVVQPMQPNYETHLSVCYSD